MIDWRDAAWEFVSARSPMRRSFFDAVWGIASNEGSIGIADAKNSSARRLGIIGDEENEGIVAVLIFANASKVIQPGLNPEQLLAILQQYGEKFGAHAKLTEQILVHIGDLVQRVDALSSVVSGGNARPVGVANRPYAYRWTNGWIGDGERINRTEFDKTLKRRTRYEIFVVDQGDADEGGAGSVFLGTAERDLQPIHYQVLVLALRNNGIAGDRLALAEVGWRLASWLPLFREQWRLPERGLIRTESNLISAFKAIGDAATKLSVILHEEIGVRFRGFGHGRYQLNPVPQYCLLQLERSSLKGT